MRDVWWMMIVQYRTMVEEARMVCPESLQYRPFEH